MNIIEIDRKGNVKKKNLLRKTIAKEFDIHFRDLRPVFSVKQVATILPRGKCFILNFGIIKMVVTKDRLFLFNLDSLEVEQKFLPLLKLRISEDYQNGFFSFFVLELALNYKQQKMMKEYMKIEVAATRLLNKIGKSFEEKDLEKLLILKKNISKFEIRARENESAVLEILEDDEELKDFCLEAQTEEAIEEAESILESFLEQIEELLHKIMEMKENTENTQEITSLKLHSKRNVIIRFDLLATMITGALTFLTLVSGIYGMNIKNKLEEDFDAFTYIVAGMGLFFVCFVLCFLFYFRRKKVL